MSQIILGLTLLLPLMTFPLILVFSTRKNLREGCSIVCSFLLWGCVLYLLREALVNNVFPTIHFIEILPKVSLTLKVDMLGLIFALVASSLWVITGFFSIGYMRGAKEKNQTRFFASFVLVIFSVMGICFSANLITFIVFFEALTLTTFPLVIHKENTKATAAAIKYFCYTIPAGLCLVFAAVWLWHAQLALDFAPGGFLNIENFGKENCIFIFIFLFIGVGVKAGIMPFHSWLPSAMAAPTPVSALLHAVAVVKAGAFGVLRIVAYVFEPEALITLGLNQVIIFIAVFTFTFSSLIAFHQSNLKARLAYSTIGHLSYIVLGAGLLNLWGLQGAVLHLMFHATMKITLFFAAGALYVHLHKTEIPSLNGVAKLMPKTMFAFTIASLGLIGVPGVNGFISKYFLLQGTINMHQNVVVIFLIISGLLNAGYFLPIVYQAYFLPLEEKDKKYLKYTPSRFLEYPLLISAGLSLVLGFFPKPFVSLSHKVATTIVRVETEKKSNHSIFLENKVKLRRSH